MSKFWKREFQDDGKAKLLEIDPDTIKINSPSVVFLTGFSTVDSQGGYIAGAIKRIEGLLGKTPDIYNHVDLYAWSHRNLNTIFNLASYNSMPNYYSSGAAKKLAKNIIMPLVAKNIKLDKKGRIEEATPLPLDEARKNLNNLTLFAYSIGTVLAQESYNAASKMMQKIGYSKKDTKELLHEVVLLSMGTMSRPTKETDRFKTVFIIAPNDRVAMRKYQIWPSLKERFLRKAKKLTIIPLSKNCVHVAAPVKKDMWEEKKVNGKTTKHMIAKLYPKWVPLESQHELPLYLNNDAAENDFATIVQHVLTNSIQRKESIDPLQLLEPSSPLIKSTLSEEENVERKAYQNRIAQAFQKK